MAFPFVAVEGQEKIKKALLLNLINEKIGGVLINGEKGTAKSTLVRGLDKILVGKKIINLPLNVTEDNLVGTLDIEKTIKNGKKFFQDGILKKAHENILYIDEINLLSDSIISTILEVSSREKNYIERDGLTLSHPSKFILIGTMNPEEGDLRPQLLDKFGLYVNAIASNSVLERVNIIKKRLDYENNPLNFLEKYQEEEEQLKEKISFAKEKIEKIKVSEQIINLAIKFVEEANCLGNRAEIILIETAKAIAAFDKRDYLNIDDLKEAATFVLPHRTNPRNEIKNPSLKKEENKKDSDDKSPNNTEFQKNDNTKKNDEEKEQDFENESLNNSLEEKEIKNQNETIENESFIEENFDIDETFKIKNIFLNEKKDRYNRKGIGKRNKTNSNNLQGRYIKSIIPKGRIKDFALDASIRVAVLHQKKEPNTRLAINIKKEDIRIKLREKRTGVIILFVVDASGSMGVNKRMEAVKGAILSLLKDAYEKRDKVGMISFRRDKAELLLPITRSVDLAEKKLKKLTTGGKTPLSEGIKKAFIIAKNEIKKDKKALPIIIFLSDGKANFSFYQNDPIKESLNQAEKIKSNKIKSIIIDTEEGFIKLELAKTLSEVMGADYYKLDDIKSDDLIQIVKNSI